jgi:hypothetical protein
LEGKFSLASNSVKFGNDPIYFSAKFHIVAKFWKKTLSQIQCLEKNRQNFKNHKK